MTTPDYEGGSVKDIEQLKQTIIVVVETRYNEKGRGDLG